MPKRGLGIDVYTAAQQRIAWTFDNFEKIYLSFSGGKDSTVMLHMVMAEAEKRNRKVGLFFIDWECQLTLTVDFVSDMYARYRKNVEPFWFSVPMTTWNACSQYEPEWTAWEAAKRDLWVRELPREGITAPIQLPYSMPFYRDDISFEEFVVEFGKWYADGEKAACFVGIRADESLNRFRTVARKDKPTIDGKMWTTLVTADVWNVYPIYDWRVDDIWTYIYREGKPYNRLYDRMYQAGVTPHQMRICEPFGDEARKGLWLYQVVEPEMWAKVSLRVAGANTGALYSQEKGAVLGNHHIALPEGHTYESFAKHLLATMPPRTAEHYKNKLAVYLRWWSVRGYPDGIPDHVEARLESAGKVPSWRKIVKTFLKNDYWCKGLGFSPTKTSAYEKYKALMLKRRKEWGIFDDAGKEAA